MTENKGGKGGNARGGKSNSTGTTIGKSDGSVKRGTGDIGGGESRGPIVNTVMDTHPPPDPSKKGGKGK